MTRRHIAEARSQIVAMCLALAGLYGCPARPQSDAGVDNGANASCALPGSRRLVISTNTQRYESGQLSIMGLATGCVRDDIAPVSSDAVLAFHDELLVVMNFGGTEDNVTIFDVSAPVPRLVCQGAATTDSEITAGNPRGYVSVGAHRGYIARFGQASLAILDVPSCAITGTIDLSPFRGIAPLPDPRPITRVGDEVWVALERLSPDLANTAQVGAIVRIDPSHDAPIDNDATAAGVQ
ncbi:MAG: hypothetical protein WCJ30_11220, partial [Deltaproteobacteria bacterium]